MTRCALENVMQSTNLLLLLLTYPLGYTHSCIHCWPVKSYNFTSQDTRMPLLFGISERVHKGFYLSFVAPSSVQIIYTFIAERGQNKITAEQRQATNKNNPFAVRCAWGLLSFALSLARQIPLSLTTIAYNHNSRHAFAALVTMNRRAPREIGNDAIIVCNEFVYLRRVLW